jgi:hypothetical protein
MIPPNAHLTVGDRSVSSRGVGGGKWERRDEREVVELGRYSERQMREETQRRERVGREV